MAKKKTKNNTPRQEDFTPQKVRTTARKELLDMAESWSQERYSTDFSLGIYGYLISLDPESQEAKKARAGILNIARNWNKSGRRYSALSLYKRLIET